MIPREAITASEAYFVFLWSPKALLPIKTSGLLFDSSGILDALSHHIAAISTFRFEYIAQTVELPFVIAVNKALQEIRFGPISLEVVSATSPFDRSQRVCRHPRFKLVGAGDIQRAIRRWEFYRTRHAGMFGLLILGLGPAQFQRPPLSVNGLESSIDCFSRLGGVAVEGGEFLRFFGSQISNDRLNKVFPLFSARLLFAGPTAFGVANLFGDKFIPGVLRKACFLLEVLLNVSNRVADSDRFPRWIPLK